MGQNAEKPFIINFRIKKLWGKKKSPFWVKNLPKFFSWGAFFLPQEGQIFGVKTSTPCFYPTVKIKENLISSLKP